MKHSGVCSCAPDSRFCGHLSFSREDDFRPGRLVAKGGGNGSNVDHADKIELIHDLVTRYERRYTLLGHAHSSLMVDVDILQTRKRSRKILASRDDSCGWR